MQRTVLILAYFLIGSNCLAQSAETGGAYPFVHYTPKDGLISNMIKGIYQDSKGRLYFTSLHGLIIPCCQPKTSFCTGYLNKKMPLIKSEWH